MPNIAAKSKTLFELYINEVDAVYDSMVEGIQTYADRMEVLGMSKGEIYNRLQANLNDGSGPFQPLGRAEKAYTDFINTQSQVESNELIKDSAELFKWQLDPTAIEHCETCLKNEKIEPMSWDEWENLGIPGAGNTDCGYYCKCTLTGVK